MTRARRAVLSGIMLMVLVAMLEMMFFITGKVLQSRWAMWRAPTAPTSARQSITYAQYLKARDPVLGWPYPEEYGRDLDMNGAQPNPFFRDGHREKSCVSLYGDSFTRGGDTSSLDRNWGNVLSELASCYVANFGVGGYGTDQAHLRFEINREDPSPVVILGFHTDDVLRNLTRIRDLLNYERWYALKPRFILNAQRELEFVPIPDLTEEQYLRAVGIESELLPLEYENFQPGGPAGVVALEFPFVVSVTRNLLSFYGFRSRLLHQPEWLDFLTPGHPLNGLEIAVGIARRFADVAKERGKAPVIIILPHSQDFAHFQGTGTWPYQNVLDGYARHSIPYIDFGPYLLSIAKGENTSFEEYFGATGHYNDRGNALVAQFVHRWLTAEGLVAATK